MSTSFIVVKDATRGEMHIRISSITAIYKSPTEGSNHTIICVMGVEKPIRVSGDTSIEDLLQVVVEKG